MYCCFKEGETEARRVKDPAKAPIISEGEEGGPGLRGSVLTHSFIEPAVGRSLKVEVTSVGQASHRAQKMWVKEREAHGSSFIQRKQDKEGSFLHARFSSKGMR